MEYNLNEIIFINENFGIKFKKKKIIKVKIKFWPFDYF